MDNPIAGEGALMQRQTSTSSEKTPITTASLKGHKLNQVVQNFYTKAAHIVIQARQPVAPVYNRGSSGKRLNRWFNIDTIETDAFREELRVWKSLEVSSTTFTATIPLTIDVVLTTRDLTANQTLVLVDVDGNRIDIEKGGTRRKQDAKSLTLERWQVLWEAPEPGVVPDLPVTYKKSIVVFRALYTLTRMLPAWRLRKRLARSKLIGSTLQVACQVQTVAEGESRGVASFASQQVGSNVSSRSEKYDFHKIETSAGKLCISVQYLTDCDFRVDDSEALLSSQFLTSDQSTAKLQQPSSLESARRISRAGSYNSFNASASSSIPLAYMTANDHRSNKSARTERRPSSTYIQPFKTPSLSASPSLDPAFSSPKHFSNTPSSASVERLGTRTNSYTQSQRIPHSTSETGGSLTTGSPRTHPPQLLKRYSSSFGQRSGSFLNRRRTSQLSDSAQFDPHIPNGSSHSSSVYVPDSHEQDLGDFVNMLDDRKPLNGTQFRNDSMIASKVLSLDSQYRGIDELDKYHRLKSGHVTLSDSISNPAMSAATHSYDNSHKLSKASPTMSSFSNASVSPGKSSSPHMPAVPSKLSEFSVPRDHEPLATVDGGSESLEQLPRMYGNRSAFSKTSIAGRHVGHKKTSGIEDIVPDDQDIDGLDASGSTHVTGFDPVVTSPLLPYDKHKSAPLDHNRATYSTIPTDLPSRSFCENQFANSEWDQARSVTKLSQQMNTPVTESSQPQIDTFDRANISDVVLEDDDLFFAMSDIHLGSNKHSK